MWKYQDTDDMYNNELYHSKYIRKYIGKSGKPVYVYQDRKKIDNVSVTKGQSKDTKYTQLEIGKAKDNWTYDKLKEKKVKIGNTTFSYSNETGTHNFRIDVDNKKKEKRISRGKSIIEKYLKK